MCVTASARWAGGRRSPRSPSSRSRSASGPTRPSSASSTPSSSRIRRSNGRRRSSTSISTRHLSSSARCPTRTSRTCVTAPPRSSATSRPPSSCRCRSTARRAGVSASCRPRRSPATTSRCWGSRPRSDGPCCRATMSRAADIRSSCSTAGRSRAVAQWPAASETGECNCRRVAATTIHDHGSAIPKASDSLMCASMRKRASGATKNRRSSLHWVRPTPIPGAKETPPQPSYRVV